jgi:hypothetical protein
MPQPGDHLQVAQAARPFLQVRLQVVSRISKAQMACRLLGLLGCEERSRRPQRSRLTKQWERRGEIV